MLSHSPRPGAGGSRRKGGGQTFALAAQRHDRAVEGCHHRRSGVDFGSTRLRQPLRQAQVTGGAVAQVHRLVKLPPILRLGARVHIDGDVLLGQQRQRRRDHQRGVIRPAQRPIQGRRDLQRGLHRVALHRLVEVERDRPIQRDLFAGRRAAFHQRRRERLRGGGWQRRSGGWRGGLGFEGGGGGGFTAQPRQRTGQRERQQRPKPAPAQHALRGGGGFLRARRLRGDCHGYTIQ